VVTNFWNAQEDRLVGEKTRFQNIGLSWAERAVTGGLSWGPSGLFLAGGSVVRRGTSFEISYMIFSVAEMDGSQATLRRGVIMFLGLRLLGRW
jgi:hypothetical protein